MKKHLPSLSPNILAAKVPNWTHAELQSRSCPVCSSDAPEYYCTRPDELDVCRCLSCGMYYVHKIPGQSALEAFYGDYGSFKGYRQVKKVSLIDRYINVKSNIFAHILENTGGIRGQRILDVGCSYGGFMQLLDLVGGHVQGVEVDQGARESVSELGYVVDSDINTADTHDIVCAFQVLEHLDNPSRLVANISRVLNSDGRFLISIPNGGEIHKVGPTWVGFRVDFEHINYFDIKTLSTLLEKHNIYIEQYWEHLQPDLLREDERTNSNTNLISRVFSRIYRLAGISRYSYERTLDGTYVLTVLARKKF